MITYAIIGTGPRGLSVLERLALELKNKHSYQKKVQVYIFDNVDPGAGRIWKANQKDCFLMNTLSRDVTMYSEPKKGELPLFRYRPTLAEWISHAEIPAIKDHKGSDFVPRKVYGMYLKDFFSNVIKQLIKYAHVTVINDEVIDIHADRNGYILETLKDEENYKVDSVVLALGHGKVKTKKEKIYPEIGSATKYINGDSAADMNLDEIKTNDNVFIKGLGLSFYDILAGLTIGRGGKFVTLQDKLVYKPSGKEPFIIAGSRSGLPLPARGRNQKHTGYSAPTYFFTQNKITERLQSYDKKTLYFKRDILPLIQAEIEHVYYRASLIERDNIREGRLFSKEYLSKRDPYSHIPESIKNTYSLERFPELDLYKLARPFQLIEFKSQSDFRDTLLKYIQEDIKEAGKGNLEGPVKAALDVMRDLRDLLRHNIELGLMNPKSFVEEFKQEFEPVCSLLTAGPPLVRLQQIRALIEAEQLEILAPGIEQFTDNNSKLHVYSSKVDNFIEKIDVYIDGILPTPSLKSRSDTLLSNLLKKGRIREYSKLLPFGIEGGIDIDDRTYKIIGKSGDIQKGIYCIGIPTEKPNWFTQVGSGTAKKYSYFTEEADLLVNSMLEDSLTSMQRILNKIEMVS